LIEHIVTMWRISVVFMFLLVFSELQRSENEPVN